MDIPPSPDGFPPLNRTDSYVVHVSRLGWQLKGHLQIILAIDGHQPVAQPVAQRIFETSSKLSKSEKAAIGQEFSASLEKMAKATPLGALMSR